MHGVAPVAYATDRVMTEEEYQTLAFPYNQTALMNYAVVNANSTDNAEAVRMIRGAEVWLKLRQKKVHLRFRM